MYSRFVRCEVEFFFPIVTDVSRQTLDPARRAKRRLRAIIADGVGSAGDCMSLQPATGAGVLAISSLPVRPPCVRFANRLLVRGPVAKRSGS